MSVRPAYDEIVLDHGSHAVVLRPTMRAASTLERSHNGFDRLFQRIAEFHTGTIREIILTAATDRKDAATFLDAMAREPISRFVEIAQGPVAWLVDSFMPQADRSAKPSRGKAVPWSEAYRTLFRIATASFHWTPEQAWNATPTEITEAIAGHVELNQAASRVAENDAPDFQPDFAAKLDRSALDKVRGKGRLA